MTLDDVAAGSGTDSGALPHGESQTRVAQAESRGWTPLAVDCTPKIRALEALASLPDVEPVASVGYSSKGNALVIGGDERAVAAAARLSPSLPVTLLLTSRPSAQAAALANADLGDASFPIWGGKVSALKGYLGNFSVTITDLAAVRDAGDRGLPGAAGAVFDLVIDFSDPPLFGHHTPPQGYWRIAGDASLETALAEAREAVGEFEKPRFFAYRENLCAHSRSGIEGCNNCIDVCSTEAIATDGDHVKVDPHLCMGCGACATVCPSGAMSFQFPRVADRGAQLKALLAAYREAGGSDACVLFHNGTDGRELLAASALAGQGLPARVIPMESWHVASVGIDLLLGAVALGANQVAVLSAGSEAPEYGIALRAQMDLAQSILAALGYAGRHFALVESADPRAAADALQALAPAAVPPAAATFALSNDKRTAVEFAVEHFAKHAPTPVTEIALAAGRALWRDPGRQGEVHAVPRLRRGLPRVGDHGWRRRPDAALPRAQLRAVRAVRADLPGGRHHPAAAAPARPGGARGAGAQRNGALPLRVLRQALRHEADGRRDARPAVGALDVRRRRGPQAPADVRRLPRGRHDVQQERSLGAEALARGRGTSGTKT